MSQEEIRAQFGARHNIRTKAVDGAIKKTDIEALTEFVSWRTEVIRRRA
jgi:hypothetical protein